MSNDRLPARSSQHSGHVPRHMTPRRDNISGSATSSSNAAGLQTRRTALEILIRVAAERSFADVLLGHRLAGFAAPDRRLVTQLVFGTIAWQGRLDYELERVCSRTRCDRAPRCLRRCGWRCSNCAS